jgi:hypothetical protein
MSSWNPLFASLLTSSVLAEGPTVVAVWMMLLASADRYGESDLTPPAVASLLRISTEQAAAAFEILASPDRFSRTLDCEGKRIVRTAEGRWLIVSHTKHRRLASKEAAAERQRRHRERVRAEQEMQGLPRCEAPGCTNVAAGDLEGRKVCTEHAFEREPGEEG